MVGKPLVLTCVLGAVLGGIFGVNAAERMPRPSVKPSLPSDFGLDEVVPYAVIGRPTKNGKWLVVFLDPTCSACRESWDSTRALTSDRWYGVKYVPYPLSTREESLQPLINCGLVADQATRMKQLEATMRAKSLDKAGRKKLLQSVGIDPGSVSDKARREQAAKAILDFSRRVRLPGTPMYGVEGADGKVTTFETLLKATGRLSG